MSAAQASNHIRLDGKRAVVTGGAKGIGAAIVSQLATAGATVVLTDVDPAGEQTAADLAGRGLDVGWQRCDITRTDDLIAVGDAAVAAGGLDIWISNAGVYPTSGPVIDVTDDFIDRMFAINVRGQFAAAREAGRRIGRGGSIVALASIAALSGTPGLTVYAATKAAVVSMTQGLARELGRNGIRVNAIAPGMIDTPGLAAEVDALAENRIDVQRTLSRNPLRVAGAPEHIAAAALFLVSDLAAFVNGHLLVVDGGATA